MSADRSDKNNELALGDLFRGLGGIFDTLANMVQEGIEEVRHQGVISSKHNSQLKAMYDVRVKFGLDLVKEQVVQGELQPEIKEPATDIIRMQEGFQITLAVPGAQEDNLVVKVIENWVLVKALASHCIYSKTVNLPVAALLPEAKYCLKDGVLTIIVGLQEA